MEALYRAYKDKAHFFLVYVREAHPSDGRQVRANVQEKIIYKSPDSVAERAAIASDCIKSLKLTMPCLLDDMDNTVQKQYQGWPARACIIKPDGTFGYLSQPGPRGVDPAAIEAGLKKLLETPKSP